MSDPRNQVLHQSAFVPDPQAECPIAIGEQGHWVDLNDGAGKWRNPDGTDSLLGGSQSVPIFAAITKTAVALPTCVYDNGEDSDGVGATLTKSTNGAIGTVGGVALTSADVGKNIVVDQQVSTFQNGVYRIVSAGAAGSKWKLIRVAGMDSVIKDGSLVIVQQGTYADQLWEQSATVTTVGTDAVTFGLSTTTVTAAAVLTALAANTNPVAFNGVALTNVKSVTAKTSTTLTIAAGVVTATQSIHAIDTEAAAASDDLDTISGLVLGQLYLFKSVSAARDVVFKHGTGNIRCDGGQDITLDVTADTVVGFYDGTNLIAFPGSLATIAGGGLASRLASTANGKGASVIGIEDSGALITATTVEAALAELAGRGLMLPIADVGTGVAIPVTRSAYMPITTAAAETNTLPDPTFVGQRLILSMIARAVGDRVVTAAHGINQTGNNTLTFGAVDDRIRLEGVTTAAGALRWWATANDGVALSTV